MPVMASARSVLWRGTDPFSAELFRLETVDDGWNLQGVAIVAFARGGAEVRYLVGVDERWRTRRARVEVASTALTASLDLFADGEGAWTIDGRAAPELDGCIDLDLEVTPATNTLPIRRAGASAGGGRPFATRVAWVRFPELDVEPVDQTYERIDDRRWGFLSGDFHAELTVDDDGVVVDYGELWTSVARDDV
jgi:hypothetical protein